jgi:predicted amidophosphoribosyltransferase
VPLHPLRRLERGYDQALLLARVLGEALQLPVITPLVRLRATAPQGAEGGRATRRSNVAGAFGLARTALAGRLLGRGLLAGRDVWLVDDVLTSGSTADACADVLRRGGARSVTVVVLARAGGHGRGAPRAGAPDSDAARPGGRAPPRGGA